jgi:hypothetical protein
MALVYQTAVAEKINVKSGKRFLPFLNVASDRMSRPYEQRAVYAVRCDSIGSGELPLREN